MSRRIIEVVFKEEIDDLNEHNNQQSSQILFGDLKQEFFFKHIIFILLILSPSDFTFKVRKWKNSFQ